MKALGAFLLLGLAYGFEDNELSNHSPLLPTSQHNPHLQTLHFSNRIRSILDMVGRSRTKVEKDKIYDHQLFSEDEDVTAGKKFLYNAKEMKKNKMRKLVMKEIKETDDDTFANVNILASDFVIDSLKAAKRKSEKNQKKSQRC